MKGTENRLQNFLAFCFSNSLHILGFFMVFHLKGSLHCQYVMIIKLLNICVRVCGLRLSLYCIWAQKHKIDIFHMLGSNILWNSGSNKGYPAIDFTFVCPTHANNLQTDNFFSDDNIGPVVCMRQQTTNGAIVNRNSFSFLLVRDVFQSLSVTVAQAIRNHMKRAIIRVTLFSSSQF